MAPFKKQSQLLRQHLSSVAVSVIVNIILVIVLVTSITLSEPEPPDDRVVKVMDEVEEVEEIEDVEELIEPEEPDLSDITDEIDMYMEDTTAENVDTSMPQEQEVLASNVVSPVIMKGIARGETGINMDGMGGEGRSTTFMGQSARGERFAFIIDYSKSMDDTQLAVMKHELTSALAAIGERGLATVLFFSGPVWRPDEDAREAKKRWKGDNWTTNWRLKDGEEGPQPRWLVPNRKNMAALQRLIYQTPITGGTDWYPPMKEILDMQPRPDIIFFMTDGRTSQQSIDKTLEMVNEVRNEVQVNTVALGVREKDVEPLKKLASMTGGKFRLYSNNELREERKKLPDPPEEFQDVALEYLSPADVVARSNKGRDNKPPPEEKDMVTFEIF